MKKWRAGAGGPPFGWPLCELCGEEMADPYTAKRRKRRFCSIQCRNTANSRVGAHIRARKARERVRRGEWENPAAHLTTEQIHEAARRGGQVRAGQHHEAIEAGTWQNPADAPGAREKLSRPRRHGDNPALHRAIEKLGRGASVSDLSPEEAEAHRAHRRQLYAARREQYRETHRRGYRRRRATPEGLAHQREVCRRQRARLSQRPPNERLRTAREQAGLSQGALAELLGVSPSTVSKWERYSIIPRDSEVQRKAEDLMGKGLWELEHEEYQ